MLPRFFAVLAFGVGEDLGLLDTFKTATALLASLAGADFFGDFAASLETFFAETTGTFFWTAFGAAIFFSDDFYFRVFLTLAGMFFFYFFELNLNTKLQLEFGFSLADFWWVASLDRLQAICD